MKTRRIRISAAVLVSAAASLVGGTASADSGLVDGTHYSIESWEDSEGNGYLGNYHILFNRAQSSWTPTGVTNFPPHSVAIAETWLEDYGIIFNNEREIIGANATARGEMQGNAAPFNYTQMASASFYVLGSQIASPTTGPCESTAICASVDTSISRNLFSEQTTFTVGFVPVTVYADIFAELHAGAYARGYGRPFIGKEGMFMGNPASSLNAGASVTAKLRADVGAPDVLAFGVTANFGLVSISVTPHANELVITRPQNATVQWNVGTPVNITTMNGSADVWVDTLFGDFSENIVSWNGASWSADLLADSGEHSFP